MPFALRLCSQLGRTLAELLGFAGPGDPLSSAEFAVWQAWYLSRGFDADRLEWTIANAGAAGAWAGGLKPADLVARFESADPETAAQKRARLRAWFDSRKGKPDGRK